MARSSQTRTRHVRLGPREIDVVERQDGTSIVRSPHPLPPYRRTMTDCLEQWAVERPNQVFLAERDEEHWRTVSYADAYRAVRSTAQFLLDIGCTSSACLAILSGNGIDHAVVALAAQFIGVPYVPITVSYSQPSSDLVSLRHILAEISPTIMYARDVNQLAHVVENAELPAETTLVSSFGTLRQRSVSRLSDVVTTPATSGVDAANAAVSGGTVAKILYTSGSTATPKGVINTQQMLCSNQEMNLQAFPFLGDGLTMIDWTPWSHTAGSNLVFNMILYNGGTLYIDDGKPTTAEYHRSLRNLRDVSPTAYFNVPAGFSRLAEALAEDGSLRTTFFRHLKLAWSGGGAVSPDVFERIRTLSIEHCGEELLLTRGLGSTETAPSATFANWYTDAGENIGLPLCGLELKLVPLGDTFEMRLRGPSVTPGYYNRDELTRNAFDGEGFYKTGDVLAPVNANDFGQGFVYAGRIGENFKLTSGTWVNVDSLRRRLAALLSPVVQDVILCGDGRASVGMLMVPDLRVARERYVRDAKTPDASVLENPALRRFIGERLAVYRCCNPESSRHADRAMFLPSALSAERDEISEKGFLRSTVIRRRYGGLIDRLYASPADPGVIVPCGLAEPGGELSSR